MPRPMKDSGVDWLGDIPADWKLCRLKDVCNGFNNGTSKIQLDKGISDYPVTRIETISSGKINYDKVGYVDDLEENYKLQKFDILVSNINSIPRLGNCAMYFAEKPLYHGMNLLKISPENINPIFLLYGLKSDIFSYNIKLLCKPAINQASVTAKDIKNIKIPLPPLDEQQRIATFLDGECARIDSVIEKTRASIVEYKKLKQAIITRAVTKGIRPARPMKDSGVEWLGEIPKSYTVQKIKRLGSYRNGLTYSPNDIVDKGQGTLILRSSNIQKGKLCFEDNVYVNADIPEQLMVQKGDIIICSRNGSRELIGKCAIVENDMVASFGAFMMIFKCDSSKYMYYILSSDVFKYYLSTFLTSTINQLTGGNFGNMEVVWCADKEEQKEIAQYLDEKTAAIDLLVEKKNQLVTELERLKKSLIFEYVTGKKAVPQ